MTDRRDVIALISKALDEVLEHPVGDLNEATGLLSDLGLNSALVLELLMVVEDAAGIEVDPEDVTMDHLRTVRAFADFVEAAMRRTAQEEQPEQPKQPGQGQPKQGAQEEQREQGQQGHEHEGEARR